MIKIADRLHNMRTLIYKGDKSLIEGYEKINYPIEEFKIEPNAKQNAKSAETITLFVPIAKLIGSSLIANELEDISNMYLQNSNFREVNGNIKKFVNDHVSEIEGILSSLENSLLKNHIDHEIRAKTKNFSEVNQYLDAHELNSVSDVPGLLSFEINVETKEECYKVLKLLRKNYKSYEIELVDYIESPKANGYKALHLKVKDLLGHTIEFKLCTHKMKLINDYGVASLTEIYPERSFNEIQDSLNESNQFVMFLQSIGDLYKDNNKYLEHIEEEILSKQITITTKDGDEYSFPIGSTVLDLAFRLHTEVGARATGAIINGVMVPNEYVLNDGDKVNIIIDENQMYQPSESLEYAKTSYAKREIRRALRRKKR